MIKIKFVTALLLTCLGLSGCMPQIIIRHQPLPEEYADRADIHGIPFARFWGDRLPDQLLARIGQLQPDWASFASDSFDILAISGGGANGAFGAGLLVGWTAAGDRPNFRVVTGISTGALIAHFAFLGPDMDDELERFYTTTSTKDILTRRNLLFLLRLDSAADSSPLRNKLLDLFSPKMIAAIAAEHKKGRRLYIGTTHLDAGRPMIWNIGEIASSNQPGVAALLADIFLASVSIPGVFPPVYIRVEANGRTYDEMHVDGGTSSQVFFFPPALRADKFMKKIQLEDRKLRIFVIRNSQLVTDWVAVSPRVPAIAQRSIGALIRSQGNGDVNQIYLRSLKDEIYFNLAFIPQCFTLKTQEEFDSKYMRALFDLGFKQAKEGFPWQKSPIGFD
jgi:predicted patatin/cPLA2 family phospholipase